MRIFKQQRSVWFLIAFIAVGAALVLMLAPHGHNAGSAALLAILPELFLGIISPLTLFPSLLAEYSSHTPQAPSLPAAFQRPPPFLFA